VFVVVCMASVASAKPSDPLPPEAKPTAKPDTAKSATKRDAKAAAPPAAKPDAVKSASVAKVDATKPAEQAKTKEPPPSDLVGVTDDPLLGKAARVNGDEMHGVVAFTFDDGPNPETTPAVIDALEKYDIPATFFIITQRLLGKHGEKSREILARQIAGGFLIGDHSMTHQNLRKAAGGTLDKEIDKSIRALAKEAARPIGLFRPPYGALSSAGRVRLKKLGVTEVIWSIDTLDWRAHNQEKLRKKVLKMILADNGGIVLMHDVKPITAKVVSEVLDDLEAENCQRLKDQKDPIVPVSIHYFLRDGKTPRAIPDAVQKRTAQYKAALPTRCAVRAPLPEPAKAATTPGPAKAAPANPAVGDFGHDPTEKNHKDPAGVHVSKECLANPLAKGCN
jgi:peptidoglycan/xylan/chitin deacetylase (PgdA/CDA1 family)